MARNSDAPSRLEILVLSTIARRPMHGYELKLELRYRHVRWWAKCEHGHLYAVLTRMADRGFLRPAKKQDATRTRRVYRITAAGRRRLHKALRELATAPDQTHFDVDVFLSGSYTMEQQAVVDVLGERYRTLGEQLAEAEALRETMTNRAPPVARLIMDHRIDHLSRELQFTAQARKVLSAQRSWEPFLGDESITAFLERTGTPIEN